MNFVKIAKVKVEKEFKAFYGDRYALVENAVNDGIRCVYGILDNKTEISFKSVEKLEEGVNKVIEKFGLSDIKFKTCKRLRVNYDNFTKVLFDDFNLKLGSSARNTARFWDHKLDTHHLVLVPCYTEESIERSKASLSSDIIDYNINVYGNLSRTSGVAKVGDMFPELDKEIQTKLEESKSFLSDYIYVSLIRSNINFIKPIRFKPDAQVLLSIDINADLIKKFTLNDLQTSVFKDEIVNIIINKFLLCVYTNIVYFGIVASYDKFKNVLFTADDSISYFDLYMNLITNTLSSNSVNNLNDPLTNNTELSLSSLLDSIRLGFLHKSSFNLINEGVDEIKRFMINRNNQYPIFLDGLLDKFIDYYRFKASGYTKGKHGIFKTADAFTLMDKNYSIESCNSNETKISSNPLIKNDYDMGIFSFYGTESLSKDDSLYERMRRTTRLELLNKLSYIERNKLFRIENELAKLRADSINCENISIQKSILRKLNNLGYDINDLFKLCEKNEYSESFMKLLALTENERADIVFGLSSRDFVKERKTQLYGQLSTKNEYNY